MLNSSSSRADIVSQILNFGLPSPIDIQLIGPNYPQNYLIAQQIATGCDMCRERLTYMCSS